MWYTILSWLRQRRHDKLKAKLLGIQAECQALEVLTRNSEYTYPSIVAGLKGKEAVLKHKVSVLERKMRHD